MKLKELEKVIGNSQRVVVIKHVSGEYKEVWDGYININWGFEFDRNIKSFWGMGDCEVGAIYPSSRGDENVIAVYI